MDDAKTIRVLLIEDDPDDRLLFQEMLEEAEENDFEAETADRLEDGLQRVADETFDVIILDLSLPDSQGVETVGSARFRAPHVPIIVLTGLDDQTVAMKTLRTGAQDYLIKNKVDSDSLERSIRYAMERQRLERELERAQHLEGDTWTRAQAVRDYHHLVSMSEDEESPAPGEGEGPGQAPLPEPDSQALHELLQQYREFVVSYVHTIRLSEDWPREALQELVSGLAEEGARARDVIRLHLCVLTDFSQRAMPAEYQSFSTDSRLALAEVLGHLSDTYLRKMHSETGKDKDD
jgi:DNA-binding NarL/FixJ family response regulator